MTTYKIRCYTRQGNLDHEETFSTLEQAAARRTEWGLSIGLKPEPSIDFANYPTIWESTEDGYRRIAGY